MRVLMITSEWPSPQAPYAVPFVVRQVEFLRKAGLDVDVFHFRGAANPLNYLRAWFKIQKRLTKDKYDVVHAQWGQSALLALPKRLPLVVTFRGSDVQGIVRANGCYSFSGKILEILSRAISLIADEVIVVSEHLARKLSKKTFHLIPSGLDLSLFRPVPQVDARRLLGLSLTSKIVLFGGDTIRGEKRFSLAQSAIEQLKLNWPDLEFIIPQGVKNSSMPLYMNAADVLLLTSLHEGSPNIVKEALACDLPVVSTDVGDVRQRIGSITGCVVCDGDRAETIAAALSYVLRQHQRINGREAVRDLDERIITQKVISVYHQALANV